MMTSSNENIFRVTGPLRGEFTGHRWIPFTKASDAELWCFFYLRLNERLRKQSRDWWFETPLRSLWRHCNVQFFTVLGHDSDNKCVCISHQTAGFMAALNQACLWGLYNPSLSAAKCRPCHRQQFQTVFLQGNLLIPGNFNSRWRHQMETFSALLALCAGNSPVSGEFPAQRPVTRIFDVFFDLRLIKRLRKHSLGWWFETLLRPLWRHCNVNTAEPFYKHDKGNPRWWPFKRGGLSWGLK